MLIPTLARTWQLIHALHDTQNMCALIKVGIILKCNLIITVLAQLKSSHDYKIFIVQLYIYLHKGLNTCSCYYAPHYMHAYELCCYSLQGTKSKNKQAVFWENLIDLVSAVESSGQIHHFTTPIRTARFVLTSDIEC